MEGEDLYKNETVDTPETNQVSKEKKSPKEVIEATTQPSFEHAFIKYPGFETKEIGKRNEHHSVIVGRSDLEPEEHRGKKYHLIHTHPSRIVPTEELLAEAREDGFDEDVWETLNAHTALHSVSDFNNFLHWDNMRYSTIAVRDPDSGNLLGYNVLMKTKETPKRPILDIDQKNAAEYLKDSPIFWGIFSKNGDELDDSRIDAIRKKDSSIYRKAYDEFLNKYHLKSKLVPAKGYKINKSATSFEVDIS